MRSSWYPAPWSNPRLHEPRFGSRPRANVLVDRLADALAAIAQRPAFNWRSLFPFLRWSDLITARSTRADLLAGIAGCAMFAEESRRLHQEGRTLCLCSLKGEVLNVLKRGGCVGHVGVGNLFQNPSSNVTLLIDGT